MDHRDQRVEKVLMLFRQLGTLNTNIELEHSFKAVHNQLFENRFLVGVSRRDGERSRDERITLICENIGMPHNLLASFRHILPHANHVYFGVEKNEQTLLFKVYLEFRDRIERQIGGTRVTGQSFPLFTGFKWDAFSPTRGSGFQPPNGPRHTSDLCVSSSSSGARQVVTQYAWYPSLPLSNMLDRMRLILEPRRHGRLLDIVRDIVQRAAETASDEDIQYLEVTEDGNPRSSIDINLYKSGLRLEELFPYLLRAARHYAIPPDRFDALYHKIKVERFGHLAAGIARENTDFMTVYYGVQHLHSDQCGSAMVVPASEPERSE
jgi:hypothetical protein